MKKIFTIALVSAAVLSATGCKGWLDINQNPNYVSEAQPKNLLPTAQMYTASRVGYEISLYGNFWAQYVCQCKTTNQYYTHMTYDVTNSSFIMPWRTIYGSVLPTLREIISVSGSTEGYANYQLEAKTMLAYNLYLLTSLYDKVAYTEGYLSESTTPHFDSGEDIQKTIISILEEVRDLEEKATEDEAANPSAAADMVFGGDVNGWVQFANTLYLKVMMRDFEANKAKIQSLLAEDEFLKDGDAAFDNFSDVADKSNPLYESDRRQLNTRDNIRACSDIMNILDASDQRIAYYYDENPSGVFAGTPYGEVGDPKTTSRLAIGATDPVYFGTIDEGEFLKAEAYVRLGETAKAKTAYETAVKAAFERVGVDGADGLLSGAYKFDESAAAEAQIEQIINQKWAANVRCMPIESWFDMNRTGYPERGTSLTDYHGVLTDGYPRRFINSKESSDYNPNSPNPIPEVSEKMWWHK